MTERENQIAVYALTRTGADTARKIAGGLESARVFLPDHLARPEDGETAFDRLSSMIEENFHHFSGHVFIAAAGLVVRLIAPLIVDKTSDPAVVVLDQQGQYAVSLLSGHLGGANDLADRIARMTGGRAVITTATDNAGRPALEIIARDNSLVMENKSALAGISRRIVDREPVPVYDPGRWLWPNLAPWPDAFQRLEDLPPDDLDAPLVWVGHENWGFPPHWLLLRPPSLALGIGCNRGAPIGEIEDLIERTFQRYGLSPSAIGRIASLDLKKDEPALLELARKNGWELHFYTAGQLEPVDAPTPSEIVRQSVGVRNVCEASAILASRQGRLLVRKQKTPNVTLAVALAAWTSSASAQAR